MKKLKFAAVFAVAALTLTFTVSSQAVPFKTAFDSQIVMKNHSSLSTPMGYSPSDIKTAYNMGSNFGTGAGKKIAIIVAYGDPNIESDLSQFDSYYGLEDPTITVHNCGSTYESANWALETAMDVEWAHAMAPKAQILVVNAESAYTPSLMEAVRYAVSAGANVVSMSWGGNENHSVANTYDSYFTNHSNVVFVASAGDDGAQSLWPACSPNVVSVGGTTLSLSSSGQRESETAWEGSGGGKSEVEAQPSWQKTFGLTSSYSMVPDIAFDADPETGASVYCSSYETSPEVKANTTIKPLAEETGDAGWYTVGGTSFGAPAWAGIIADLNQRSSYIAGPKTFYQLAGSKNSFNLFKRFYDITSGSNGNPAGVGYDEVTGLGTPNCDNFFGVTYSGHVQKIGWQNFVSDGALSGTSGRALRMEAIKIKLNGVGTGSIIYRAHVQSYGWQKAVKDGAIAGTTGKSKRVEAVQITLSGLSGYKLQYRAHVQKKGWLAWQTVSNGTGVTSAPIGGTTGLALRMEALEIKLVK